MTSKSEQSKTDEVLDSIQQMKNAALLKAMPPQWFGGTIAFVLFATVVYGLSIFERRWYK